MDSEYRPRVPHTLIRPPGLMDPKGYNHGVLAARGRTLYVAGQIGCNADGKLVSPSFVEQFEQSLKNVLIVVEAAGGEPTDLCRLCIYVTDTHAYLAELRAVGNAYRKHMSRHYCAMALVEVAALLDPLAKVEIEAIAVIPEDRP